MKPQHFTLLTVTAATALIAAVTLHAAHAPWTSSPAHNAKMLPSFAVSAARAQTIEITQGESKLTIERTDSTWRIKDRDGFPAATSKVRELLVTLADAELVEPKTRLKDRLSLLDVDDPTAKNTNARLIRVLDNASAVLAEIIAGKSSSDQLAGRSGTYVRKPGDEQSWLTNVAIQGGARLEDWTQARVFETPTETLSRVTISVAGDSPYDLKYDGTQHVLADMPAGKKIKFVNATDLIVEAASFIDFHNVRKKADADMTDAGSATLESSNGLTIKMTIRRDTERAWATVEATGQGDAKKAADDINSRASGWEFEILPSKVNTILKRKDDLLEDAAS